VTAPLAPPVEILTAGRALELLREVVAERPDYIYEGVCSYADPDGTCPRCLVGHVLHRHGFPVADLAAMDEAEDGAACLLPALTGGRVTPDAAGILYAAQLVQDALRPWSEALAAAEDVAVRMVLSG
jgi:hypothetical protein